MGSWELIEICGALFTSLNHQQIGRYFNPPIYVNIVSLNLCDITGFGGGIRYEVLKWRKKINNKGFQQCLS